jgi:hypothetical protein
VLTRSRGLQREQQVLAVLRSHGLLHLVDDQDHVAFGLSHGLHEDLGERGAPGCAQRVELHADGDAGGTEVHALDPAQALQDAGARVPEVRRGLADRFVQQDGRRTRPVRP